jgi:hypothetical protein
MSGETRRFEFLLTRQEGFGITAAAVVEITADTDRKADDAWKQFRAACTEWLKTRKGREAWEESCEDFNVADALNHGMFEDQKFVDACIRRGIGASAQSISIDTNKSFDEVLNDNREED